MHSIALQPGVVIDLCDEVQLTVHEVHVASGRTEPTTDVARRFRGAQVWIERDGGETRIRIESGGRPVLVMGGQKAELVAAAALQKKPTHWSVVALEAWSWLERDEAKLQKRRYRMITQARAELREHGVGRLLRVVDGLVQPLQTQDQVHMVGDAG